MRLGAPVAATMPVSQTKTTKTSLVYHASDGFEIVRTDLRTRRNQQFKMTAEEFQGLILHWPEWRDWLLNAGVDNVAPVMPFHPVSTVSPEPASSPSSQKQESLL